MGIRLVMWLRVALPQMLGPAFHKPVGDRAFPQSGSVFLCCGHSDCCNRCLNYNTKNYKTGLKNIEGGMFQNRGGGGSFTVKRKGVGAIWF